MLTRIRLLPLLAVALLVAAAPASASAAHPTLGTGDGDALLPGFDWGVGTYGARCNGDGLTLTVGGAKGWSTAIGGGKARRGGFSAHLDLSSGEGPGQLLTARPDPPHVRPLPARGHGRVHVPDRPQGRAAAVHDPAAAQLRRRHEPQRRAGLVARRRPPALRCADPPRRHRRLERGPARGQSRLRPLGGADAHRPGDPDGRLLDRQLRRRPRSRAAAERQRPHRCPDLRRSRRHHRLRRPGRRPDQEHDARGAHPGRRRRPELGLRRAHRARRDPGAVVAVDHRRRLREPTTSRTGTRSTSTAGTCTSPSATSTRSTRSNRRTGRIVWKLGGTETAKSLEVRGDPRGLSARRPARRQRPRRTGRHRLRQLDVPRSSAARRPLPDR